VAQFPTKVDTHHEQYAKLAGFVRGELSGHGLGSWRRDRTCALGLLDCEALFFNDASGLMNVPESRAYVINECFQKKTGVRISDLRGSVKGAEFFDQ
jgi:hypothetical protein